MTSKTASPVHPDLAAHCRDNPVTNDGEDGREREGSQPASSHSIPIIPSDVSLLASDRASASGELAAMRAQFIADFAGGTMGNRHNTYEHRSRILRQMAGKLSQ